MDCGFYSPGPWAGAQQGLILKYQADEYGHPWIWATLYTSIYMYVVGSRAQTDMHCPTLKNVTFWRATRCGWWIFEIFF